MWARHHDNSKFFGFIAVLAKNALGKTHSLCGGACMIVTSLSLSKAYFCWGQGCECSCAPHKQKSFCNVHFSCSGANGFKSIFCWIRCSHASAGTLIDIFPYRSDMLRKGHCSERSFPRLQRYVFYSVPPFF